MPARGPPLPNARPGPLQAGHPGRRALRRAQWQPSGGRAHARATRSRARVRDRPRSRDRAGRALRAARHLDRAPRGAEHLPVPGAQRARATGPRPHGGPPPATGRRGASGALRGPASGRVRGEHARRHPRRGRSRRQRALRAARVARTRPVGIRDPLGRSPSRRRALRGGARRATGALGGAGGRRERRAAEVRGGAGAAGRRRGARGTLGAGGTERRSARRGVPRARPRSQDRAGLGDRERARSTHRRGGGSGAARGGRRRPAELPRLAGARPCDGGAGARGAGRDARAGLRPRERRALADGVYRQGAGRRRLPLPRRVERAHPRDSG